MNTTREPTAIFVADTHFHLEPGEAEQKRLGRFLSLLELAERADHLILLGDIFDFWFDYPHFRLKGYEPVLQALDRVRDAGTTLHFIGGNHDIWAADYFHRRYGTSPHGEAQIITLGTRRILLTHGDGQLKFDWAYNAFRAMVRTRVGIVLAKSLHPEILYALSEWLSGKSRGANRDEAEAIVARARKWIAKQPPTDWDLMVMGHVHHGFQVTAADRTLASLAGWFDPLGYALLQDGVFSLRDFATDPPPAF